MVPPASSHRLEYWTHWGFHRYFHPHPPPGRLLFFIPKIKLGIIPKIKHENSICYNRIVSALLNFNSLILILRLAQMNASLSSKYNSGIQLIGMLITLNSYSLWLCLILPADISEDVSNCIVSKLSWQKHNFQPNRIRLRHVVIWLSCLVGITRDKVS